MRSTNKSISKFILFCSLSSLLCGCGETEVPLAYGTLEANSAYAVNEVLQQIQLPLFAEELCTAVADSTQNSDIPYSSLKAACVYSEADHQTLYSYHANERLSPASLTKIMTALLVFENCPDLDEVVTVGNVTITENGAQVFKLNEGDRISIRDLLYITLVYSGNDAALALALHVGGSVDNFATMMNQKAFEIGATNTHFVNPHGLNNEEHYTCAYDLYLMFHEAAKYPEFLDIIQSSSYSVSYTSADGTMVSREFSTTNQYLNGSSKSPSDVIVVGGKTGSTAAAGKCIILYVKSAASSSPYIVVVMGAEDIEKLYQTVTALCEDTI